ncbi:uncharacterized protein LOC127285468 [Leptopilina boulardi]|uniref:uncharacterized protein LOC127285468 n=1 Tax=Leptopilina boulardi TaxID=63433 RepID=UPI0021F6953E|nr:uncharacterized protein LOC127285468 [Leptopilina boulardi]XP_051167457.1 uncharacterized protein LOC127285468 [Leptopilina boulardi]
MKLWYTFFILIVGAVALPNKRDVDEETTRVIKSLPFMAIVSVYRQYLEIHKWAIILTEKWILSSINISPFKNIDITVRVYTDLFTTRGYEYGVESTRVLQRKNANLYPPFSLIELQSSINFGDLRKPIPLAGPNYEWQENEVAYYLNSDFKFVGELSEIEYFEKLSIKVIWDETSYESDLNDCLESEELKDDNEFECEPVILNGTLIGFLIDSECENQPFLKISSIYNWILKNIPELQNTKYQFSVNENTIILPEILQWKSSLLQRLFEIQKAKMINLMNFNNNTFNIKLDNEY